MSGDGSNIPLIYIEDEQPLVGIPTNRKKRMCPMRECAPLSPTTFQNLEMLMVKFRSKILTKVL